MIPFVAGLLIWAGLQQSEGTPPPVADGLEPARSESEGIWIAELDYRFWSADFDFGASTTTTRFEDTAGFMHGVELRFTTAIGDAWAARVGFDYLTGLDSDAVTLTAAGEWMTPFLDGSLEAYASVGALFGVLTVDGMPGEFGPGAGAELGVGLRKPLRASMPGFHVSADLAVRHLEFRYKADSSVIDSDDSIGGLGLVLTVGFGMEF